MPSGSTRSGGEDRQEVSKQILSLRLVTNTMKKNKTEYKRLKVTEGLFYLEWSGKNSLRRK